MSDWYYVIRNNVIDSVSTRPRKNVQNPAMIRASTFHKKNFENFSHGTWTPQPQQNFENVSFGALETLVIEHVTCLIMKICGTRE